MINASIPPVVWNWKRRSPVCFVDFETQSNADLRKTGVWGYIGDKSTRLLSAVFKVRGRRPLLWVPRPPKGLTHAEKLVTGTQVPDEVRRLAGSHVWVAHNAEGFDALVWATLYPDIAPQWRDTQILARCLGLPGSLDALSRWFGGTGKSEEGSRAMKILTSKAGVVGTLPIWKTLLDYNVKDVTDLEEIYAQVAPALKHHAKTLEVHSAVNDRGVAVDKRLAAELSNLWELEKNNARDEIADLTGGKLHAGNVRSGPSVHAWLKSQGLHLETLRRDEVSLLLDDPDTLAGCDDAELVREVLALRSLVTRTAESKLDRLLLSTPGNRLRYWATYHAASTGRWGSRGVQIHNLPRGDADLDVETLLGRPLSLDALGDDHALTLNTLTRPVFVASEGTILGILDYSAVEARGVAWLAGEDRLLERFAAGDDVYLDMASGLFGRDVTKADKTERQVGKVVVLGCGYSMGGVKFGLFCRSQRIDLEALNLTGEGCVKAYRERYPAIPALWKQYEDAAFLALRTRGEAFAGRCRFHCDGDALVVTLPSGRPIYYQRARIAKVVPMWARLWKRPVPPRDAILYTHPRGYEKTLYGGLITENITQAVCRDLLAESLVRWERAGLRTVVHVHDELVFEGSADDLETAARLMAATPRWAKGFPVGVEGFTCPRYVKQPWEGSKHVKR